MKKNEVKIGKYYTAKVSNRMATIRIDAESPHGGWKATNITTGKKVRIKSAQCLRRETRGPGERAKTKAIHAADQENARLVDERAASGDGMTASERAMAESAPRAKKSRKAASKAKAAPKRDTRETGASSGQPFDVAQGKPKRLSAVKAAAKVLEERDPADGPLSCKQMIERMAAKGYWTPTRGGLTPANTLYASILREINTKGEDSRFEKVERGRFTLALKG